MEPKEVLKFWFEEAGPAKWFGKDEQFDARIRERFGETHARAMQGGLGAWRTTPQGRLAEIIVLDQFSRNLFRGSPQSFENDVLALRLAREAVADGTDKKLPGRMRHFLYMPYLHSESLLVHEERFGFSPRSGSPKR